MTEPDTHLQQPVVTFARKDFPLLKDTMTVGEALNTIRRQGVGERIVYFYVAGDAEQLVGVIPTRRLLTSSPDQQLNAIMLSKVVTIPETASVLEACEFFIQHRFLALPVVDGLGRIIGVIDVNQFTDEVLNLAEREQADSVFEALGFRVSQVRDASPIKAFRIRFPWLLASIVSGTLCAMLVGAFEATLAQSMVLAFFLALVLGLGESVSIQSMTVTIQALRAIRPTFHWYVGALRREVLTALLIGAACGITVAAIVWTWRGERLASAVIGLGIFLSLLMACVFGLTVPWLLHALKLDPKIAAGPVTLALTDISTLAAYFLLADYLL